MAVRRGLTYGQSGPAYGSQERVNLRAVRACIDSQERVNLIKCGQS